jgi:hypothetical protein
MEDKTLPLNPKSQTLNSKPETRNPNLSKPFKKEQERGMKSTREGEGERETSGFRV